MNKNYFIYILHCADDTLYCGYTDDVAHRLATHNAGKGAKYTKARLPVKLLTFLKFSDKKTAMKAEWWFKHKLTKAQKLKFINSNKIGIEFEKYIKKRSNL